MVYLEAHYWLRQPTHRVQAHLAGELGLVVTGTVATDLEATEVLPVIAGDPPTELARSPAAPSPLAPRGPRGRGRRTKITAGPGSTPTAPGLAVAPPRTRRPVRVALCFRWKHDMAGLTGTDVAADLTLPTTTVKPDENEIQDPSLAGPGSATAGAPIPPPPVHHHPRTAR